MSGLERSVRDLLGRRSLSGDQLRALETLQGAEEPALGPWSGRLPGMTRMAFAVVVLFAVLAPILAWLSFSALQEGDLSRRIADEVAANHLKLKPMEVRGARIADVRDYFTELDFLPVQTRLPGASDLELLGGRYCSVQGVTAAQLRLRQDEAAPLQTLYQAPYDPQRFGPVPNLDDGERPLTLGARGLEVQLWVEKGILVALIRE